MARTAAHYLLEGIQETGVKYIFANFGTDHVSIIEELARWDHEGRPHPEVVLCPHENVAMHMAGGYALATGEGQAVMVHVDAGTANSAMATMNFFRTRVPLFLMAGKAPHTMRGELPGSRDNYVHFVQDPFDMNSIVRPYVKWEYALPSGIVAKEAVRRAHSMMHSDPAGPVFMTLPRETLAEEWDEEAAAPFDDAHFGAVKQGGIDPQRVDQIADRLMAARNPILVTSYAGRNADAVETLRELAETCGIRVVEFSPIHLNFPRDSECFAGFDVSPLIADADLGLLVDVDVPFLPKFVPQGANVEWIQIDMDAIKRDMPMWGFRTDMRIEADSSIVLRQVLDTVKSRKNAAFDDKIAQRKMGWRELRQARLQRVATNASNTGTAGAIAPDFLFAKLQEHLSADDVVINEAIRSAPAVLNQLTRTKPGTYFTIGGGGLGFGGGLALGVKLARPQARVVDVVGDGSFHFGNHDSVLSVASEYGLPILTVVLDNGGWQAVKEATLRVYPTGVASQTNQFQSRLQRSEGARTRHFDKVAQAFGAHAERVEDPAELEAAIERCIAALDRGQAALLNVAVTPL